MLQVVLRLVIGATGYRLVGVDHRRRRRRRQQQQQQQQQQRQSCLFIMIKYILHHHYHANGSAGMINAILLIILCPLESLWSSTSLWKTNIL
jgi:hypothetical protein